MATMNVARALANVVLQGLEDGSTARDSARQFMEEYQRLQDPRERVRDEAAAREQKQSVERFKRLEARMHARRAARLAKERATRGEGWAVLDRPVVPHAEIDRLTRSAWALAFHQIPFPDRWRVRWARLRPTPEGVVLGMAVKPARLILVDEQRDRGRSWRELLATVFHDLVHVAHDLEGGHGATVEASLRDVLAYAMPEAELEAAPLAARPGPEPPPGRPQPPTGVRWGRGGWYKAAGLQPDLEYR
jgi:hypothetical protein